MANALITPWNQNCSLKADLRKYVEQSLTREEILDFIKRDYGNYKWSIRTLDRRLREFEIYYSDKTLSVSTVENAVKVELEGPGALLGYRAMQKKLRQVWKLNVPRDLVHDVMYCVDPEALNARAPGAKKKKKKGNFTSPGPDMVHSLDGHDKLMGYQNSTFPIAIYGCIDTASRKLLWLKVWTSNSNPELPAKWYFQYLKDEKKMASMLRLDKGSETGIMATMHSFLRRKHGDMDPTETVIFGPSTANQIERWWKELHERLEKYYKHSLNWLKDHGIYDPSEERDRSLMAYLMIPIIQQEVNVFKDTIWNTHRIRAQKDVLLPSGIPNHIYDFPEKYGMEHCGWEVSDEDLDEVEEVSGITEIDDDYLVEEFRKKCESILPDPLSVVPKDCKDAFTFLKEGYCGLPST